MKTPLPSQEDVTAKQVSILLGVYATLTPYFLNIAEMPEGDGKGMDGGAKMALENTLVKLCERMESILDDQTRWSLVPQKNLEAQLSEVYATHLSVLKEQKTQLALVNAPHSRFSPTIMQMPDGSWAAFLGEPHEPLIAGVGKSPEQALLSFDAAFQGKEQPPHVIAWLKEREIALINNLTPPAEPKKNENPKVDAGAGSTTQKPEIPKSRARRNRKGARKNPNRHRPKGGPSAEDGGAFGPG